LSALILIALPRRWRPQRRAAPSKARRPRRAAQHAKRPAWGQYH